MSLQVYLAFVAACIALALLPGPIVTLLIANGLRHGTRAALTNIMGVQTGMVIVIGILAVGAGFVANIPIPAIAGVSAWMGLCLLDWSAWRRLPKMRRVDAVAFLATALAVLCVNAVLAVAIGCSLYAVKWALHRVSPELRGNPARSAVSS